jgi:hypothetical protein
MKRNRKNRHTSNVNITPFTQKKIFRKHMLNTPNDPTKALDLTNFHIKFK